MDMVIADFFKERADDVHKRILERVPSNISNVEGDMYWDTIDQVQRLFYKSFNQN